MEQPLVGTLTNPSPETLSPFPRHRRRNLESETFSTLVHILSRCYGGGSRLPDSADEQEEPQRGSDYINLGQTTKVCGGTVGPTTKAAEMLSNKGDVSCSKVVNVAESVNEDKMEADEFNLVDRIDEGLVRETGNDIANTFDETHRSGSVIALAANDGPQDSLLESLMEDSEILVKVDKEKQGIKLAEAFDFSLNVDDIGKFPTSGSNELEGSPFIETGELGDVNVEKLPSNYGLTNPPLCTAVDGDVEEGEISGDFVIDDELMGFLFEEEPTSDTIAHKEHISNKNEKWVIEEGNKYDKNFEETEDEVDKGVTSNLRENDASEMELESERVVSKSGEIKLAHEMEKVQETVNKKRQADMAYEEYKNFRMAQLLGESATAGCLSDDKDAGAKRKRKRGPMTEEKRAKKKKKERIRRAEKNRQLGVKRLKIQPVLKPKTVAYCRHYLMGRCHEGENCKFSHDTIPLTKSKPCHHFARNSCMKGEDCPFDHQLFKYPCDKYLSTGFCNRGTNCLFSHEVPPAERSPGNVNASKSEVQVPSLSKITNSEKQKSMPNSSNQKADTKSGAAGILSSKVTEQKVAETKLKVGAVSAPKGISKLLFGKSSLSNPSKLNQVGTISKADGSVKFNQPTVSNLNDTTNVTRPQPKGINFLSFGNVSTHDSCKDDIKQAFSPSKHDDSVKCTDLSSSSKTDLVYSLSETPKRTPSVPPRGINFLSVGKALSNQSSNMMIVTSDKGNGVFKSAIEREEVLNPIDQLRKDTSGSALKALFSNRPSSAQKSLRSTLAFAAKYESKIKTDHFVNVLNTSKGVH